jgi:hypothetical protein
MEHTQSDTICPRQIPYIREGEAALDNPQLVLEANEIRDAIARGEVIGADTVCPICHIRPKRGRKQMTCSKCADGATKGKAGRKQKHRDDEIVSVVDRYASLTVDDLLFILDLKSKTTLIRRLRKLRDDGRLRLIERSRHDGFTIMSIY